MRIPANRLTCSLCGGMLKASSDAGRFVCSSCGSEVSTGKQSFQPVVEAVEKVQTATDKTAAELALKRLQRELQTLMAHRQGLESEYDSRVSSIKSSAPMYAVVFGVVLVLLGLLVSVLTENPKHAQFGFLISVALSGVLYAILSKGNKAKSEAIARSMNNDFAVCDKAIYQVKKKLAENFTIADS